MNPYSNLYSTIFGTYHPYVILSLIILFQEKWNASIAYVVGNKLSDYDHISALGGAVTTGLRRMFSFLSKEDLFAQVFV